MTMTLEEFKELCSKDPEFKKDMLVVMQIMDEDADVFRALASGAVPSLVGIKKAEEMRKILKG